MLHAGRMDEWIRIRRPAATIDDLGDEVEPWPVLTEMWAERIEVGMAEILRTPQIKAELDCRFKIRDPGVSLDASMRIEDEAERLYEIKGIVELPRRGTGFEIMAKGLDRLGATVA